MCFCLRSVESRFVLLINLYNKAIFYMIVQLQTINEELTGSWFPVHNHPNLTWTPPVK